MNILKCQATIPIHRGSLTQPVPVQVNEKHIEARIRSASSIHKSIVIFVEFAIWFLMVTWQLNWLNWSPFAEANVHVITFRSSIDTVWLKVKETTGDVNQTQSGTKAGRVSVASRCFLHCSSNQSNLTKDQGPPNGFVSSVNINHLEIKIKVRVNWADFANAYARMLRIFRIGLPNIIQIIVGHVFHSIANENEKQNLNCTVSEVDSTAICLQNIWQT